MQVQGGTAVPDPILYAGDGAVESGDWRYGRLWRTGGIRVQSKFEARPDLTLPISLLSYPALRYRQTDEPIGLTPVKNTLILKCPGIEYLFVYLPESSNSIQKAHRAVYSICLIIAQLLRYALTIIPGTATSRRCPHPHPHPHPQNASNNQQDISTPNDTHCLHLPLPCCLLQTSQSCLSKTFLYILCRRQKQWH